MDIFAFYQKVQSQLNQQLPFVVYRKSGENNLQVFFQHDDSLYEADSYDTSGFIFAPFSKENKTILIPSDKSTYYTTFLSNDGHIVEKVDAKLQNSIDNNYKKKHLRLVNNAIRAIHQKIFKKVVLSRKEKVSFSGKNPLEVFQLLSTDYPDAFVYYWYHPKIGTWLGATPETLVTIKEDRFFTMALAGTQPYTDSLNVDWGTKDIEEQAIVTDFIFNELSSKCKNITKSEAYTYKAGTLLHLRTDIKGTLKNKKSNIADIIKVLHPTPAVCGLPKEEARRFILEKEPYERKYYTGFLGELCLNEDGIIASNLYVNLRCMEIQDENALIYVGGGITKDSIAEKEWEETVRKTETMKRVLQ